MLKYYEISESAARDAKRANSFSDYVEGSATQSYMEQVDDAAEIAERQKKRVDPEYHARIDGLLDSYARRLADNLNQNNRIAASCPSVLIAGGSNFPVAKKNKQNARADANMRDWQDIQGILDKIKSVGTGGIGSDDPRAQDKLRAKLEGLEKSQARMKEVNAYFRKHKTLEGCPSLTPEAVERYTAQDFDGFPSWMLTNNNANIRRIKERLATLEKEAERAAAGPEEVKGDGYTMRENTEAGRLQFLFDDKPDEATRSLLKSHGFHWSPREGAWQRLLNDNARYAAKQIIKVWGLVPAYEAERLFDSNLEYD